MINPKTIEFGPSGYRQLNISLANVREVAKPATFKHFRVVLKNLSKMENSKETLMCLGETNKQDILRYDLTAEREYLLIDNLMPDAFFEVRLYKVLNGGEEIEIGYISSSMRVPAAPPYNPPANIRVSILNETSILMKWDAPVNLNCTGELRGYRSSLKFKSFDKVLAEKEIEPNLMETIFTSLSPGTGYSVKIAAFTRAGLGPYSSPVSVNMPGTADSFEDYEDLNGPPQQQFSTLRCHPLRLNVQLKESGLDYLSYQWTVEEYQVVDMEKNSLSTETTLPANCVIPPESKISIKWDTTNSLSLKNTRLISSLINNFTISQLEQNMEYYVKIVPTRLEDETYPHLGIYMTNDGHDYSFPSQYPKVTSLSTSWAMISWSNRDQVKGFIIKIYQSELDDFNPESGVKIKFSKNPNQSKLRIDELLPSKVYKFSVCQVTKGMNFNSPIDEAFCTRTQAFETPGTKPDKSPRSIGLKPSPNLDMNSHMIDCANIRSVCNAQSKLSLPIKLWWTPEDNVSAYGVFISGDINLSHDWYFEKFKSNYNSVVLQNLKSDCQFYIKLAAINSYGSGPISKTIAFKTPDDNGLGGGLIPMAEYENMRFHNIHKMSQLNLGWNDSLLLDKHSEASPINSNNNNNNSNNEDFKWLMVGCISGLVLLMIIIVSLVHIVKYVIKSKNIRMAISRDLKTLSYNGNDPNEPSLLLPSPNSLDYLSSTVQKAQSINTSGFHSCSLINNIESHSQVINSTGRSSEMSYQQNRKFIVNPESESNTQYRVTPVESEPSFGYNPQGRRTNFKPIFTDPCHGPILGHHPIDCDASSRSSVGLMASNNGHGNNEMESYQNNNSPKNPKVMSNSLFYQNNNSSHGYNSNNQQMTRKNSEDPILGSVSPTSSFNGLYREQFGSFGRHSNDDRMSTHSPNQLISYAHSPSIPGSRKQSLNQRNYLKTNPPVSILTSKTYSCNMNGDMRFSDSKMNSFKPYVTPTTPRINAAHLHSPAGSKSSLGYDRDNNNINHGTSSSGMGESPAPGELSTTPQISSNSSAVDEPNSKKFVQNIFMNRINSIESKFHSNPPPQHPLQRVFSTEELSVEMANLEGLMKDLSEITNKEYKC